MANLNARQLKKEIERLRRVVPTLTPGWQDVVADLTQDYFEQLCELVGPNVERYLEGGAR